MITGTKMTALTDPPHDPTMEEILASIRKIISEDQPDAGPARGAQQRRASSQAEILELTEEIPPEEAAAPLPESRGAAEPNGREPLISPSSRNAIDRAIDSLDKASVEYSSFAGGMLESVFTRAVQDAVGPNVQQWVSGHEPDLLHAAEPMLQSWIGDNLPGMANSALAPEVGRTLHEAVTPIMEKWVADHQGELMESLKPMIRDWMDQHLPQMVESVLKQEFGRAVTEHLRRRLG
jgi:hypothetical protein